jgi:hypothetical protein
MFKKAGKIINTLGVVAALIGLSVPHTSSAAVGSRYVSNTTIMDKMVKVMDELDGFQFNATYNVKSPPSLNDPSSLLSDYFQVGVNGKQLKDRSSGKTTSELNVALFDLINPRTFPQLSIIQEPNKTSYVKLSKLNWLADELAREDDWDPYASTTSQTNLQKYGLDTIENQWIKFDATLPDLFLSNDEDASFFAELQKQNNSAASINGQVAHMIKAARKQNLYTITRLKDESVNGYDTYHLKLTLNKTRIIPFLRELNKTLMLEEGMFDAESLKELAKELPRLSSINTEVWVGKNDYFLRRVVMNTKIKETTKRNAPITEMQFSMDFFEYDYTASLIIPTVYKNSQDVWQELLKKWDSEPGDVGSDWEDESALMSLPLKISVRTP